LGAFDVSPGYGVNLRDLSWISALAPWLLTRETALFCGGTLSYEEHLNMTKRTGHSHARLVSIVCTAEAAYGLPPDVR
jgi:hypothetical protein